VDGRYAVEKAKKFRPGLIILDFSMPVTSRAFWGRLCPPFQHPLRRTTGTIA